ncbi:MAG TPA: hypothetical protein VK808_01740 [Bacteroidia bacterium]|nr:hypothetical protein [Bacteroidia bacterium]
MKQIATLLTIVTLASCGQGGKQATTANADSSKATAVVKTPAVAVPGDWKTYTHANYSIQYPANWQLKEGEGGVAAFTLAFASDSTSPLSGENISLAMQDMGGQTIDLAELAEAASAQFKIILTNYALVSSKKLTDATGDYQQTIFNGDRLTLHLTFEQLYRNIGGKLYILTLTAPKEAWDKGQKVGEQIMGSFSVTK